MYDDLIKKYQEKYESASLSNLEIKEAIIYAEVERRNNETDLDKTIKKELDKTIVYKIKMLKDVELRNNFIMDNLNLYKFILKKYPHFYDIFNTDELKSFAFESLVEAIDKYSFDRNSSFSTYALTVIYKNLQRYVENNYKMIREPVGFQTNKNKVKYYISDYEKENEVKPSISQISKYFNISEKQVKLYLELDYQKYSLNTIVNEETYTEFGDLIPDSNNNEDKIFEMVSSDINRLKILDIIKKVLTTRQYEILSLIIGIENNKPLTANEVANKLGVTHQSVSIVYEAAVKRLIINKDKIDKIINGDYVINKNSIKEKIKRNLYDYFLGISTERINIAICSLSSKEINVLKTKFGIDFKEYVDSSSLDLQTNQSVNMILRKLQLILTQKKDLKVSKSEYRSSYSSLFENSLFKIFVKDMTIQQSLIATLFILDDINKLYTISDLSKLFSISEGEVNGIILQVLSLLKIKIKPGDTEITWKSECKRKIKEIKF